MLVGSGLYENYVEFGIIILEGKTNNKKVVIKMETLKEFEARMVKNVSNKENSEVNEDIKKSNKILADWGIKTTLDPEL